MYVLHLEQMYWEPHAYSYNVSEWNKSIILCLFTMVPYVALQE